LCYRPGPALIMPFLSSRGDLKVILSLYIQPKASLCRIVGLHDKDLKLAVKAPPVDGRANTEVISFMAKLLKVPKSSIEIHRGKQGRRKKLLVCGFSEEAVRLILTPLL
jgi:uncharacterized protein (TIGR00251 family)